MCRFIVFWMINHILYKTDAHAGKAKVLGTYWLRFWHKINMRFFLFNFREITNNQIVAHTVENYISLFFLERSK